MATAKKMLETKPRTVGVVLELTVEEADYVRCAIGRASGGEFEGSSVYNALSNLGLPEVFDAAGTFRINRRK